MRSMRSGMLGLAVIAAFLMLFTTVATAEGESDRLHEIPIESAFHHLGDGEGFTSFIIPDAEGTRWQGRFRVDADELSSASTAHLRLWLVETGDGEDSVSINGHTWALPGSDNVAGIDIPNIAHAMISVPIGFLQPGANTIAFEAGLVHPNPPPTNTHDDFEFGDVVLILSG